MRLELKDALFAFLSARETATRNTENPNATVHLAAAMLFAGFQNMVATMWYAAKILPKSKRLNIPFQEDARQRRANCDQNGLREAIRTRDH